MNEGTHFFIKIYISHTLFLKGWCCAWEMSWRRGKTVILTQSSPDHSSTSSSSWLGLLNRGSLRPKDLCLPLPLNSASCPQMTQAVCALVILLFIVHLLPPFFYLFTQVHLLIHGSVEGQYITSLSPSLFLFSITPIRPSRLYSVTEQSWCKSVFTAAPSLGNP